MYSGGKRLTCLEKFLDVSVKWMIEKCCGCSRVRRKWGIWEFSFKSSASSICTGGYGWWGSWGLRRSIMGRGSWGWWRWWYYRLWVLVNGYCSRVLYCCWSVMKFPSSVDNCVLMELLLSDGSLDKGNIWVLHLWWKREERRVHFWLGNG